MERLAEIAEWGAASSTIAKDDHAWDEWVIFFKRYSWDPIVSRNLAVDSPSLVVTMLSLFTLWAYPRLIGKLRPDAKPRSAFAYALAIMRIFERDHGLPMPRFKLVETSLKGLLRS